MKTITIAVVVGDKGGGADSPTNPGKVRAGKHKINCVSLSGGVFVFLESNGVNGSLPISFNENI